MAQGPAEGLMAIVEDNLWRSSARGSQDLPRMIRKDKSTAAFRIRFPDIVDRYNMDTGEELSESLTFRHDGEEERERGRAGHAASAGYTSGSRSPLPAALSTLARRRASYRRALSRSLSVRALRASPSGTLSDIYTFDGISRYVRFSELQPLWVDVEDDALPSRGEKGFVELSVRVRGSVPYSSHAEGGPICLLFSLDVSRVPQDAPGRPRPDTLIALSDFFISQQAPVTVDEHTGEIRRRQTGPATVKPHKRASGASSPPLPADVAERNVQDVVQMALASFYAPKAPWLAGNPCPWPDVLGATEADTIDRAEQLASDLAMIPGEPNHATVAASFPARPREFAGAGSTPLLGDSLRPDPQLAGPLSGTPMSVDGPRLSAAPASRSSQRIFPPRIGPRKHARQHVARSPDQGAQEAGMAMLVMASELAQQGRQPSDAPSSVDGAGSPRNVQMLSPCSEVRGTPAHQHVAASPSSQSELAAHGGFAQRGRADPSGQAQRAAFSTPAQRGRGTAEAAPDRGMDSGLSLARYSMTVARSTSLLGRAQQPLAAGSGVADGGRSAPRAVAAAAAASGAPSVGAGFGRPPRASKRLRAWSGSRGGELRRESSADSGRMLSAGWPSPLFELRVGDTAGTLQQGTFQRSSWHGVQASGRQGSAASHAPSGAMTPLFGSDLAAPQTPVALMPAMRPGGDDAWSEDAGRASDGVGDDAARRRLADAGPADTRNPLPQDGTAAPTLLAMAAEMQCEPQPGATAVASLLSELAEPRAPPSLRRPSAAKPASTSGSGPAPV